MENQYTINQSDRVLDNVIITIFFMFHLTSIFLS